jgi:predicted GTPase
MKGRNPAIDDPSPTTELEEHELRYNGHRLLLVDTPGLTGDAPHDRVVLNDVRDLLERM